MKPFLAWAEVVLSSVSKDFPDWQRSFLGHRSTYFTCCSGLGTAEIACKQIREASAKVFRKPVRLICRYAMDPDPGCQRALLLQDTGHLWSSIYDFFPKSKKQKTGGNAESKVRHFCDSFVARNGSSCERHAGCRCVPKRAHGSICGSPCQPWSRMGAKRGQGA